MIGLRWSLFVGILTVGVVYCQNGLDQTLTIRGLCNAQGNCRDCILANPMCTWCADAAYNLTRCYAADDPMFQSLCPEAMRQDPRGGQELSMGDTPELTGFTQVSPSRVVVDVRPGLPQTFDLRVRPARNFPIDLYLLMDLSYSMEDDLTNLKSLGAALARSIVGLSANFSIGFGSFVEKVVGPFTTLDPVYQMNPCDNRRDITCEPTYSYRHVISLTSDSNRFDALVQQQQISGNQDLPEGGFDGFLQSLLCTEVIGWREISRKLLLYITDAGFHLAGDGKLGGIIRPHESTCRLTPNGQNRVDYEQAEIYDYPSVGQIAQALRDQDIIPIFAATSRVREVYDALATELGEGAFTGTLEADSRNVVVLVENLYNTISQRVIFDQEPVPGVSVVVNPVDCPGGFIENNICNGLQIESIATFAVSVSITECTPELESGPLTVPIRVVGFGTFNVVLNAVCQCPCEMQMVPNSPVCNGNGTLSCGQCTCNPGNFGQFCQCDATNQGAQLDCPVGDNNMLCTGRGTCACGICSCRTGFFGPACECDVADCVGQDTGLVCTGRGTCGCSGQCMCNVEPVSQLLYNGSLCECTPNTQNCRDPTNVTTICNGRGTCGCDGSCLCQNPYFGQFCELCSGEDICIENNCELSRMCANCVLDVLAPLADDTTVTEFFRDGNPYLPNNTVFTTNVETNSLELTLPLSFCPNCSNGVVIINGSERATYDIDGFRALRCEEFRECTYRYFIAVDEETTDFTRTHVEFFRSCPEPQISVPPWVIVLSILIPLIIAGIILLVLLKVLLLLLDFIEVQKFEKDIKNTKYSKNENPLYRSAAKEYQNPTYGQ